MAGRQIESGLDGGARPADASADAAAQGLRNLNRVDFGSGAPNAEARPADLLGLERYARERAEFRPRVIAHKKHRTVHVRAERHCAASRTA